jgi:hypothetical protein
MNCEDFNKIIDELAEYKPMQATIRDAGFSHIALCAGCAAKLANARTVSNGLVLAASAENEEATTRVKENLSAAFTELWQAESVTARVVDISSGRKLRWWTAAAVAVAAALLLAVILPRWREVSAPDSRPASNELKAGMVEPSRAPEIIDSKPVSLSDNEKPGATVKPATGRRLLGRQRRRDAETTKQTYETVAQNTDEYLPLTYLAKATAIDSGTIVRVELSRSALARLGLPLNFEGTASVVRAEVVIGDDGVARAIRLVQ